ncbi:MAG: hypothetical protein AMJ79_15420 [Phycisphaerae bacterium SM23_30]|nr:MAG: hypothetical protein AMJ79_15420 [Phycisphaerae bacterium SM23_30]
MLTFALQSGSHGNCIYVETEHARLLFDAGISGKMAQHRLSQYDRDVRDIDAVIISHDHRDHVSGAGIFHRKFHLPVYITPNAWSACRSVCGPVEKLHHFIPGQKLHFGATIVRTIPTPHDSVDSVAFVIEHDRKKLGIFTDLGHRFDGIEKWIRKLDGLYLESNYDPDMLRRGDYPPWLKRRIAGPGGHLSNQQAAQLVLDCSPQLQFLALAHLSQNNNHPCLALAQARKILPPHLHIAPLLRTRASELFTVE